DLWRTGAAPSGWRGSPADRPGAPADRPPDTHGSKHCRHRPLPGARAALAAQRRDRATRCNDQRADRDGRAHAGAAAPTPGRYLTRAAITADGCAGEPEPAAPRPRSARARALGP